MSNYKRWFGVEPPPEPPSPEEVLLMCIPDDLLTSKGRKAKAAAHEARGTMSAGMTTPVLALSKMRPEFVR